MTVDGLITALQAFSAAGHGSKNVVVTAIRWGDLEEEVVDTARLDSSMYGGSEVVYLSPEER